MRNSTCKTWLGRLVTLLVAFAFSSVLVFAQTKTVTGTVVDEMGEPVIGANVVVAGTTNGATTDIDGNFSIQDVAGNATLNVSFIGYTSQSIALNGRTQIKVTLSEDSEMLDDVVVIGYQTVRRKDLTGSVASVNNKALAATPVSNVAQALQGKLPGVNVTSQDGRPDAAVNIRVRGGGSVSQSNEPLILIDGIPGNLSDVPSDQVESIDVLKDASSTAIYGARGANGVILVTTKGAKEGKVNVSYHGYMKWNTPTDYIDAMGPYDYLRYVWANAAANDGWSEGDFTSGGYVTPFIKLFGIGSYGNIENYKNIGKHDNQKDIYGSSFSHSHDFSVGGGTDKTKVLFNVNYVDEEGMKINSYSKRANVGVKFDQQINKDLKFNLDARYTEVRSMSDESTSSGSGSILSYAYRFRPISYADMERFGNVAALLEGNVEHNGKQSLWETYSPYARIKDYEPLKERQTLRATGGFTWNVFKDLSLHTELFMSRSWSQNRYWSGPIYNGYLDDSTGEVQYAGAAQLYKGDSWSYRWTNTINYNKELNQYNRLNALVGYEVAYSKGNSMTMKADHYPSNFTKDNAFAMINQYDAAANSVTAPFYTGTTTPESMISYFGRLNYSLFDRYLFTFTMRADGSSKFTPNKRWGFFPAAAIGWRIKDEAFLRDVDAVSNLKLRLSYGEVGNDGIDATQWQQYWAAADSKYYYTIDGVTQPTYTLASSQMANPDLKWETTITRNVGLDFGFLNGRINGTIDAYWNTTKDLLMLTTLPGITGFTTTFANIGQTSNKGLELSLNGTIFQNKDWTVSAGFNINFNKNNVDELAEGVTGIYGTSWFSSGNPSNDFILEEDEAVGRVRGLKYVGMYSTDDFTYDASTGVYTLKPGVADVSASITGVMHGLANNVPSGQNAYPGMAKYEDTDGNGTVDSADYTVIGDMNATHTGGFNFNVVYKNWDLGAYFNWSYGNEIYNINRMASLMGYKETGVYQNHMAFMNQCYKIYDVVNNSLVRYNSPEELNALNADAKYPLCYNESGVVSDLGIEDGSYLRLGTLTLGYTLPKSLISRLHISNLRVYGTVYNLLTISDYSGLDPEVSTNGNLNNATYPTPGVDWGAYPRARSFVVGLNVNF